MEEAKVVYVIYKVWTQGFADWLLDSAVSAADLDAELDRLRHLMAFPDGRPLDRERALGGRLRASAVGARLRGYDLTVAAALVELAGVQRGLAPPAPGPLT